jgi:cell division protein FtsZ
MMKPRIAVIGVGGAGGNAVNNMIAAGLTGAEFIVANTDAQALDASSAKHRVQLGQQLTEGLGAGSKPDIGQAAAEEAIEEIRAAVAGCHMVFIAAGMGGGTGTGAAWVIARAAKDFGILTVAVVTKPFQFEGSRRMRIAEAGIAELKKHVDTLLVIPNQNLFRVANDRTTFAEAFVLADQVLYSGVACIVDLIVKEGLINLDLADVRTVLSGMGTAMMGTGEAAGEQRAIVASEEAIVNPLLDDVTLKGAKSLLLSITGGRDLTLWEVDEAANRVRQEVDPDANIIVGATFDETLGDKVRVSIVASGMSRSHSGQPAAEVPSWTPQQPGSAPPRAEAPADFHRRLSAAIDEGAERDAGIDDLVVPETRRAPGEVYIQEGPPQLSPLPPTTWGRNRASASDAGAAEPVRTGRTVPGLEDFPPHAQREYWAKSSEGEARATPPEPPFVYQREPEVPPPKTSLLRRLTGVGRGGKEPAPAVPPKHSNSKSVSRDEQQVDLPVFFGRGKR